MARKGAARPRKRLVAAPDLVYVVRPGDDNEELRYSLRSVVANAPHGNVWLVGTVPAWVKGVKEIPLTPQPEKFANQRQSLHAVTARRDLSNPFVLMNDDMFIMEPISGWQTWHLDTIEDHWGGPIGNVDPGNPWLHAVWQTYKWMQGEGYPDPLYYENHTPLLFDKGKLAAVLSRYPHDRPFVVNGTYPITGAGGEGQWGANAKVNPGGEYFSFEHLDLGMPYLSSEDETFKGILGDAIRARFPEPSQYEEAS